MPIAYEADTDNMDTRFIWAFAETWKVGGDLRLYRNAGSFAVDRTDGNIYVETIVGEHYVVHVGFRAIDYSERLLSIRRLWRQDRGDSGWV